MHIPSSFHVVLVLVLSHAWSGAARADELDRLLQKGPVVRIDTDTRDRFDAVLAIVDVNVPAGHLWDVLADFSSYRFFMPRVEDTTARRQPDGRVLVDWRIDTPLVATRYTNEMTVDAAAMTMRGRTIEGDMMGSTYEWRIVVLSDTRCRLYHTARPRQMAAIVDSLDDEHQTITVGVAVSSVMATMRSWKARAESLGRARPQLVRPPPVGVNATPTAP